MASCPHLYLKSDDDNGEIRVNTSSNFSNKLVEPIHFNEPMSVCLKGIEYTNSYENYNRTHDKITLFDFEYEFPPRTKVNPSSTPRYGRYYNLSLQSGFYDNIEDFVLKINRKVRSNRIKRIKYDLIMYDSTTRKCTINVYALNLSLIIKANAISLLGLTNIRHDLTNEFVVIGNDKTKDYFKDKDGQKKYFLDIDHRRWKSSNVNGGLCPFSVNLDTNLIMNIFLDILRSNIFGSVYSKLLKKVNSKSGSLIGERMYQEFTNHTYLPLETQCLDVICVEIKNQYGYHIKMNGSVILFLHFRPQRLDD